MSIRTNTDSKVLTDFAPYCLVPYAVYELCSFYQYASSDDALDPDTSEWTPTQLLFAKAFIAALTSGLGGFPLYLIGELPEHIMGIAIIFAAGLMSGCSAVLFIEALQVESSILLVVLYTAIGMLVVHAVSHCVGDLEDFEFAGLKGQSATKALVIVLSMGLHSLGEGVEHFTYSLLSMFRTTLGLETHSDSVIITIFSIQYFCKKNIPRF